MLIALLLLITSHEVYYHFTYDDAGRLLNITHSKGEEIQSAYQYYYDNAGYRYRAEETLPLMPVASQSRALLARAKIDLTCVKPATGTVPLDVQRANQ